MQDIHIYEKLKYSINRITDQYFYTFSLVGYVNCKVVEEAINLFMVE